MQVNSVCTPIKKCVKYVRNLFSSKPVSVNKDIVSGSSILADQNKILVNKVSNAIEPLQTKFNSRKEMLSYAKERCISSLKKDGSPEHAVVMDLQNNKVLAEYIGTGNKCVLQGIENLNLNPGYTAVMHGHPDSFPISSVDVKFLLSQDVNQVIAVDINGQYSLISKKSNCKYNKSKIPKAYISYLDDLYDGKYYFRGDIYNDLYKGFVHSVLKEHTPNMNLRYWTNYDFLKSK